MRRGILAALAALGLLLPGGAAASAASAPRPNIVIFYIDDAAPIDGRLWSDPALTPTLADYFVAHGTRFSNAMGETPLCCPGRAGLLTGLHTHNHGVLFNDARLFNPREHIGTELKNAGYATMWIGKYLNLNNKLTAATWKQHGKGWTYLDALYGENGRFFNYKVHTKSGTVSYGNVHSTKMAAQRTVARIRSVDPAKPIFAVVSMYNMHVPNVPMPGFEKDPRWAMCAAMPPWAPPNYNEADMSDKPAYLRSMPLLPYPDGYPMNGYCREMLGVDWAVKTVIDELARSGRLENSLLVFTADNGVTWGAHRVGRKKELAFATGVPLYMWWPARWGETPRVIDDLVSNIDIAPTLCELAGCDMGPYPTGQQRADGESLVGLLDGSVDHLDRRQVLESSWEDVRRRWHALRTGADDPLGPWHYIDWATGERELYDLTADPWELDNVAGQPQVADVQQTLAQRLAQLRLEGVTYQPDGSIVKKVGTRTEYVGDGIYLDERANSETVRRKVDKTLGANFSVRIENDGGVADSYEVTCAFEAVPYAWDDFTSKATCLDGSASSSYTISNLAAHGRKSLTFRITLPAGVPRGAEAHVIVTIRSTTDPEGVDVVRAIAYR